MSHQNLYIVDNSSENRTVEHYLSDWCDVSRQMDIATGYLEVGGLLSLDGKWQKLDKIRIILGNEVTKRTKAVIEEAVNAILQGFKKSIDTEQDNNEFLLGVPAILDALKTRKIECRVYDKSKFHAKAYITYFRDDYRAQFIQSMPICKACPLCMQTQLRSYLLLQAHPQKYQLPYHIRVVVQIVLHPLL